MNDEQKDGELSKLDVLHKRASAVLFSCDTLFPFDLFPDTLVIDYNKVDIIYRSFFGAHNTVSIPIERLNYVGVDSVFFLSALKIETKGLQQNPDPLHAMRTADAQLAKNLIFGLMAAEKHNIDLTHLGREAIIDKLIEIGKAN